MPEHVCSHLSICLLKIEGASLGMMEKNPTNIFLTICPKTLNKGAEVHFTCQRILKSIKINLYIIALHIGP